MRKASLQLLYGHDTNMLFGMILDFANAAETNVKANTDWSVNVLSLERFRKFTEFVIKVESIELIVGSSSIKGRGDRYCVRKCLFQEKDWEVEWVFPNGVRVGLFAW